MDYEKAYNNLMLEHMELRKKLKETSEKAIKYIDAYEHQYKMRQIADRENYKLHNTIKVLKMMNREKDAAIAKLTQPQVVVYQQDLSDIIIRNIDIVV